MKLQFNGETVESAGGTLADLLEEQGLGGAVVATAVNGRFVARTLRDGCALKDGDRVEAVAPMQGG